MANLPAIVGQSTSDITAASTNNQIKAWLLSIMKGSRLHCPLYDGFIGGIGSGKAIIEIANMNIKGGNTLIIPTYARGGGRGVQGNGTRTGAGEKVKPGEYTAKTGRWWKGYNIDSVAKEETALGTMWDQIIKGFLTMDVGEKKQWDIEMMLRGSATGKNTIRPNSKGSRELLRSADTVSWDTVEESADVMRTLGGKGMNIIKQGTGATTRCITMFGGHLAFSALKKSTKYLEALNGAAERGDNNYAFRGDFAKIFGNGIYPWEIEDHDRPAPVGSIIMPRGLLGTAIAAGTTAIDILFGGSVLNAALTDVGYTQAWSNAPYTPINGTAVAAVTDVDRYCLAKVVSGADAGKFGMFKFVLNDGNKLTMKNENGDSAGAGARLAAATSGKASTQIGNVTWNTGVWAGKHTEDIPLGSELYECNSYGQPFCFLFALGEHSLVCGHADVDGTKAIAKMTEEIQNHGMQLERGVETAWGVNVVKSVDNQPRNYVLVEAAYNPPGLPTIV